MKVLVLAAAILSFGANAQAPAARSIKMQSTWPASNTLQEHFKTFGERLEKLTQGSIKIEAMPAGCIAVADAMGVTDAGIFGDILCARMPMAFTPSRSVMAGL